MSDLIRIDPGPVQVHTLIGTEQQLAAVLRRATANGQLVSMGPPTYKTDGRVVVTVRLAHIAPGTRPAISGASPVTRRRRIRLRKPSRDVINFTAIGAFIAAGIAFIIWGVAPAVALLAAIVGLLGHYILVGIGVLVVALVAAGVLAANRCPTCGR